MKKIVGLGMCGAVAMAAAGCFGFERKSTATAPTASGLSALLGSWTSSNIVPSPGSCTDFKWNVTEQTTNSAGGTFSATCAGDLKLSGTAQGTLSGSVINWTAEGTANAAGLLSCRFSLIGTAELAGDSVRVPYSGDTCLGKVSGVQTLRKQ